MVAPVVKFYNELDVELNDGNPNNLGVINAGSSSEEKTIKIKNNPDGDSNVSAMEDIAITTVTKNGYNSGDGIQYGQEAVEGQWMQIKSVTDGDSSFTPVGGTTVKNISDINGAKIDAPGQPTGTVGHGSGGKVGPGNYYAKASAVDNTGETLPGTESAAVTVAAMVEQLTDDAASETLDTTTNTKIAQKFTSGSTYCNGAFLKMASAGTLVGNLRMETDNSGSPSGTLAAASLEKENVTLTANAIKNIFTDAEGVITDATTYWLVFVVTSGSGTLRGTTTGTADQVKIYNGSWVLSSNIENLVYGVIDDNKISWDWGDVTGAASYKLFRTTSSGTYGDSSLLASPTNSVYDDKLENTSSGQPLSTATVTYEHEHEIKERIDIPTNASGGAVEMEIRLSYSYI